jgi:CHAD domain-containing protein
MALNPKRVQKPFRKLRKLLKEMPRQPLPNQVHDLRTNTRALEAMASALSLDSRSRMKKLLKDLARIRKRAGKVRDLDVLTSYAATLQAKGEQDCSVRLIEHLGAERRKKARKLHSAVTKQARVVRPALKQTSSLFAEQVSDAGHSAGDPGAAAARATASALKLERQLSEPRRLHRRNLHPYRLKVKELRNVLRMAEEGNSSREFVDVLGEVKDSIGAWHDWQELLSIAREVLDHHACKLIRELNRICQEKYSNALKQADDMRRSYLRVARRKNSPSLKPKEPVLTATTAMAA